MFILKLTTKQVHSACDAADETQWSKYKVLLNF